EDMLSGFEALNGQRGVCTMATGYEERVNVFVVQERFDFRRAIIEAKPFGLLFRVQSRRRSKSDQSRVLVALQVRQQLSRRVITRSDKTDADLVRRLVTLRGSHLNNSLLWSIEIILQHYTDVWFSSGVNHAVRLSCLLDWKAMSSQRLHIQL